MQIHRALLPLGLALGLTVSGLAASFDILFVDCFDRPDGPVGNGWTNFPDNMGGDLSIVDNELTVANVVTAGISRPITFDQDLHVHCTITETDGFDLIGSRFTTDIKILSEGNFTTGYGIGIGRTEADTNNSHVILNDVGGAVETIDSPFQFDSKLDVDVTFFLDGRVVGTITEGNNTFNFSFGPHAIQSSGDRLICTLQGGAAGSVLPPRLDELVIGTNCPADLNLDDVVDAEDLAILLSKWGSCP